LNVTPPHDGYPRAGTDLAVQRQLGADGLGSLAHDAQPKTIGGEAAGIESGPIVPDV
jgi:hypothetical protein